MSKDLFSKRSDVYAKYRPRYPARLFEYILQFVPGRLCAWDCACGNGQAAILLADYFESIEATDLSEKQISNAIAHPKINYSVSPAEKTIFKPGTFDLVTVAQAYHWLDFAKFETEVKRVAKPTAVIAIWGYGLVTAADKLLNEMLKDFYHNVVGTYWDPERKHIDDSYNTVPFPYNELPSAEFCIEQSWDVTELTGYLKTWSSVEHFKEARGFNPVDEFLLPFKRAWATDNRKSFKFPIFLKLGKVHGL